MRKANNPITIKSAFATLSAVGYPKSYVVKLMPDWWDNSLLKTTAGVFQFALILKQRLGIDISFDPNGDINIQDKIVNANFKHRVGTTTDELHVVASIGIALARLAIFSIVKPYSPLPRDPSQLHKMILNRTGRSFVDYEGLLDLCWDHGIPVLFLKEVPRTAKRMMGMVAMVHDRPAILLGFNYEQHAKQLFVLAHELAHIICGHVDNNNVLVDEDIQDVSEGLEGGRRVRRDKEEKEADTLALSIIRNGDIDISKLMPRQTSAASLAALAISVGSRLGIDQGHLILSYAKAHDDWIKASQALNFFEQKISAIDLIKDRFIKNTETNKISMENIEYLLSAQGF